MRCKNCGTENDDNRYICENCGSPLYDEANIIQENDNGTTRTFKAVNDTRPACAKNSASHKGEPVSNDKDDYSKSAEKKSIIVIAILAVVLVAIIISVILIAQSKNNNEDLTSSTEESTTVSTTAKEEEEFTTEYTTESTTESTTEKTTESTTKQTTAEPKSYSVKLVSKGGGTVDGSGSYRDGDNVTIIAYPDENYVFDGWYSSGKKLSSSTTYSFTATKDISISAVFTEVVTEEDIEEIDGGLL